MYLRYKPTSSFVEVLDFDALINPCRASIIVRFHAGEELQEPEELSKAELAFPSGEELPRCWRDVRYRA